jgi:integrase
MQSKHAKQPFQAEKPVRRDSPAVREPNVSKDGMWRRFPETPHLLQHVPTLCYYAAIKIGGYAIRRRLEGWTPAMIRASLATFLRRLFLHGAEPNPRAVELFEKIIRQDFPDYRLEPGNERAEALAMSGLTEPEVDLAYVPTPENFERLLETLAARQKGPGTAFLVRFLACSGCRVAEAGQLRWADIDWEHGEMVVNHGLPGVRRVPLNPSLRELLEGRKNQDPDALPNEPVLKVTTCRAALKKACDELGIPPVTPLDLRYLFIFRAREAGVDVVTIGRWLGHQSIHTLSNKVIAYPPQAAPAAPKSV